MKTISLCVCLSAVLALTAAKANAESANFWINESRVNAGRQGVGQLDPAGGTRYIWGQTEGDETLVNFSMNLLSDSTNVALTGINVLNPVIASDIGFPPKDAVRYEFVIPARVAPNALTDFNGFTVTNADRIGLGMGPDTGTSAAPGFQDPFYDPAHDAFLIASFDYSTSGNTEGAGLWLQIGPNGLHYAGGRSADVSVVFGNPNDPPLNGAADRQWNSATPDAVFSGGNGGTPCVPDQFCNLDFEHSDGVESGVPHWEIPDGIPYLYNSIFAGEGSVTLYNHSFPFFGDGGVGSVLEGGQSLLMSEDDYSGSFISQVGYVPDNAIRIEMLMSREQAVVVALDGVPIPLTVLEDRGDFDLVSGNISDFAGTTATLSIRGFGGHTAVDAIQFRVPEPMTLTMASIAICGLWLQRKRRVLPAASP